MIFIWEGAVASLPGTRTVRALEKVHRNLGDWGGAVGYWQVNDYGLKWMWAILVRTDFRIDICITTRPPGFGQAVARKCEQENWPVRHVFCCSAPELGRRLSTMPDVERVVYGLEEQRWAYGPQGLLLSRDSGQLV
jgi:hypothetical protein